MEIFTGLGLILGPPIGGWLYQAFGYEIPFIVLGGLLFLMVPFNIWLLPSQGTAPLQHDGQCSSYSRDHACRVKLRFQAEVSCGLHEERVHMRISSSDADPSNNSFFKLCTILKIPIICFVVLTLSSGLGFLDATLSLFAIDKVREKSVMFMALGYIYVHMTWCYILICDVPIFKLLDIIYYFFSCIGLLTLYMFDHSDICICCVELACVILNWVSIVRSEHVQYVKWWCIFVCVCV